MPGNNHFIRLAKIVVASGSIVAAAMLIRLAFTLWMRRSRHHKFVIHERKERNIYINIINLVYAASSDNYTTIYFIERETLQSALLSRTLKSIEEELSVYGFVRVSKFHLFHPDQVERIDTDTHIVTVKTGKEVKVTPEAATLLKDLMEKRG